MSTSKETASYLLHFEKQMKKSYNENNKLQKQSKLSNRLPLFVGHCILKNEYVVSYIRAFDGAVHEVYVKELETLLNPVVFKKGAFIISKYEGDTTPINESVEENPDVPYIFTNCINLPMESSEYVNCGTTFSDTDIVSGGKVEFHGTLGLLKTVTFSMIDLHPISVVKARHISSMYIQAVKQCEDVNDLAILLIPCKSEKPLFLNSMICYPGRSTSNPLLHITEVHDNATLKKQLCRNQQEVTYYTSYDILGAFNVETDELKSADETSLKINFNWNGGEYQAFQQPPHSAKTVLQLQVTVGESRSAANDIFQELTALDVVFNNIIMNSTRLLNTSSSVKMQEKLMYFKESVSDFSYYGNNDEQKVSTDETDDLEKPMSQMIQQSFQRNDQDFTDKLWTFLRQDEVMEDLRGYLDDILSDIVDGDLQPAVSPTNETKLAKYIRRMYLANNNEGKLHMKEKILEFISSDQSVQALVSEIGFEKLRKDYYNFFLSKELASINDLQKLFKPNNPIDIAVLWKLHYCFEIVITPAIYLNLAQDCQSTLLKAAVDYYSNSTVQACSPIFCMSLLPFHDSTSVVHQACEAREPTNWQCGRISINKAGYKETNVWSVKSKNVLPVDNDTDIESGGVQHSISSLSEEVCVLPNRQDK